MVTGATGRIGGAVAAQLLEKGVPTRAMVHRDDARSARLRALGAEVVVADMFDIQQVSAAMDGVDRLYFNPPYHPHALDSAVTFAVAARRNGVEAVVALGQWLASPEHPSLMTRQAWLTDKLFELLPDTAHVAVDPGYFADNYLQLVPMAAQLGVLPTPTGTGRNAPPSNEDIARVAVGALLDPHRHDGRAYRPTGPELLSGADIADAVGRRWAGGSATSTFPQWMFMRAVRLNAKELETDQFFESSLRHYLPEHALGTFEVGGPTTHVADVAGVEPEDFLTIARRYVTGPESRRTAGNLIRQVWKFMLTGLVPMHRLDKFDRRPTASPARASPAFGPIRVVAQRAHRSGARMNDTIAAQYSTGLSQRNIEHALIAAGKDLDHLQPADLGLLEDFHTMGRVATSQLVDLLEIDSTSEVLDAGSGIGGTARSVADRFGSRVTAVDLTDEYCDTNRWLNRLVGLSGRISVRQADVTKLPFADATFDVAISQHVQMNVADKERLYSEARRVLVSDGRLGLWDITIADNAQGLDYPLPWADRPERSHLATPDQLRAAIEFQRVRDRAVERPHRSGKRIHAGTAEPAGQPTGPARLRHRLQPESREPHPRACRRTPTSHPRSRKGERTMKAAPPGRAAAWLPMMIRLTAAGYLVFFVPNLVLAVTHRDYAVFDWGQGGSRIKR